MKQKKQFTILNLKVVKSTAWVLSLCQILPASMAFAAVDVDITETGLKPCVDKQGNPAKFPFIDPKDGIESQLVANDPRVMAKCGQRMDPDGIVQNYRQFYYNGNKEYIIQNWVRKTDGAPRIRLIDANTAKVANSDALKKITTTVVTTNNTSSTNSNTVRPAPRPAPAPVAQERPARVADDSSSNAMYWVEGAVAAAALVGGTAFVMSSRNKAKIAENDRDHAQRNAARAEREADVARADAASVRAAAAASGQPLPANLRNAPTHVQMNGRDIPVAGHVPADYRVPPGAQTQIINGQPTIIVDRGNGVMEALLIHSMLTHAFYHPHYYGHYHGTGGYSGYNTGHSASSSASSSASTTTTTTTTEMVGGSLPAAAPEVVLNSGYGQRPAGENTTDWGSSSFNRPAAAEPVNTGYGGGRIFGQADTPVDTGYVASAPVNTGYRSEPVSAPVNTGWGGGGNSSPTFSAPNSGGGGGNTTNWGVVGALTAAGAGAAAFGEINPAEAAISAERNKSGAGLASSAEQAARQALDLSAAAAN